jgi:phosphocarrier protein HPr
MEYSTQCSLSKKVNSEQIIKMVSTANQFDSYILIEVNNMVLNAKSLLSMCQLRQSQGSISLTAFGNDCKSAIHELKQLCIE